MFFKKLASAEIPENFEVMIDSDVDEEIKVTEKTLAKISKKSAYRKPNMIEDDNSMSDDQ